MSVSEDIIIDLMNIGTNVGMNCKPDQEHLCEETDWNRWYGEIVNFDFKTGLVKVKDENNEKDFLQKQKTYVQFKMKNL